MPTVMRLAVFSLFSRPAPSSVGYHRSLISQVKEGKGFHYNKLRAKVETEARKPERSLIIIDP